MKRSLTLGPAGIRALVALCSHAEGNGSFAVDGKWIARVLIETAGAREDVKAWRVEDRKTASGNTLRRLADSKIELDAGSGASVDDDDWEEPLTQAEVSTNSPEIVERLRGGRPDPPQTGTVSSSEIAAHPNLSLSPRDYLPKRSKQDD